MRIKVEIVFNNTLEGSGILIAYLYNRVIAIFQAYLEMIKTILIIEKNLDEMKETIWIKKAKHKHPSE